MWLKYSVPLIMFCLFTGCRSFVYICIRDYRFVHFSIILLAYVVLIHEFWIFMAFLDLCTMMQWPLFLFPWLYFQVCLFQSWWIHSVLIDLIWIILSSGILLIAPLLTQKRIPIWTTDYMVTISIPNECGYTNFSFGIVSLVNSHPLKFKCFYKVVDY